MFSVLFGLLAALSWGGGDFIGGISSRRIGAVRAVFYADGIGIIFLLAGLAFSGESYPAMQIVLLSALAGALGSTGLMVLYQALRHGKMSVATPVSALMAAVLPVVVGAITQGLPKATQLAGFALALIAIWMISQGEGGKFHIEHLSDLKLPLLAGLGFGSYFVLMHHTSQELTFWPMVISRTSGTLFIGLVLLWKRESPSVPRSAWSVVLFNGLFDVGGTMFYVLAAQSGRLDIAAVLASVYPGATTLLAWIFLKEKISRNQGLGILLVLFAIALMTIA